MGSGCHAGCIHSTHVIDGRIAKVKRVTYPDGEKGTICIKGVAGARLPYHPERLKYPLKRAGKRGEKKWMRITWEQALDEIAERIKNIREAYSPESILMEPVWNSTNPLGGIQPMLGLRLRNLLQATGVDDGIPIDSNPLFANFFNFGTAGGANADPRTLLKGNTKYMIAWGTNPAETSFRFMDCIDEAHKRGAKFVDIGLILDRTAERADWWIPVKAGSDTAFALAMIHCIIDEKLYDEEYIIKYTNGPFLVRSDNGKLLREADLYSGGDEQKYVIWDQGKSKPETIEAYNQEITGFQPALFGTYKLADIECKPAFQLLVDVARNYRSGKVQEITGVPFETIKSLAREYATTKPAAILIYFGLRYKNSGNAYRAINTLGAITGNIGTLGGGTIIGASTQSKFNAPSLKFNDTPIISPTDARSHSLTMTEGFQCMTIGKPYLIKALLLYGSNLLHTFPNHQRWINEIIPNLELIVVNDIFMTATAEYADYVLPDCTVFEREDIDISHGGYVTLLEKAIEPLYECRPPIYFWSELARRLGLGNYFDRSIEEWMELRLNSQDPSIADIKPPLTLERLKKEKMVRANVSSEIYHRFLDKKFTTPSGRIELYNEELISVDDALPVFREQIESPRSALAKEYPLTFNTANPKYFMHTMFANETSILKAFESEPHVSLNFQDAQKRNINEGDIVEVYNGRGSCKVKATISKAVPPGVVHIPHGWWPEHFIEGHPANLLLSLASSETKDESREIYYKVAEQVAVGKVGLPETRHAYSPDTIFDCLCEVKKSG
jgi:molybdopterin-containing oxidoreductase family molybdopterin binding subunit